MRVYFCDDMTSSLEGEEGAKVTKGKRSRAWVHKNGLFAAGAAAVRSTGVVFCVSW